MYKQRFKVTRYNYEVDYDRADSVLIEESHEPADFSEALEALNSDYWDNIDKRDTEVILHPADWQTNHRTGAVTYDDVVISCDNPRHLERLMNYWQQTREAGD